MAKKEFSSGGIIVKKGHDGLKVLLIKDIYGHWTWPKGHIEAGETPQEAAVREIGEETGLKGLNLVGAADKVEYYFKSGGRRIFKTVQFYLFEAADSATIKVRTSEIEKAEWFSAQQALEQVEYKGAKALLKKALDAFLSRQP